MNEETSIGQRLRVLMEEQGIGENELARRSGVPQPTIHRILSGRSKSPRNSNLEKISAALGTTASYLAHGVAQGQGAEHVALGGGVQVYTSPVSAAFEWLSRKRKRASLPTFDYPVLTYTDISPTGAQKGEARGERDFEPSHHDAQGDVFWLIIKGDAMSAPIGASPSFPEGTMVLLDTGLQGRPGHLVLATLPDSSELTFRKLIEESGQRYLKPLNPAYPLIPLENEGLIQAVAVEAKTRL